MENEIYKTPEADLEATLIDETDDHFYVVSPQKFLVLFFMTVGVYRIYWFYRHWAQHKKHIDSSIWPIPRAIFSIFFTHSLFDLIDFRLKDKNIPFNWTPGLLATCYVILLLVETVVERLSSKDIGSPMTDIASILLLPVLVWPLYRAQLAANAACSDPQGAGNSQFTPINWLWIVIGVLFWGFIALGMYSILVDYAG
ncbi:MAG TPA: hypothetical protein VLE50_01705 [Cellvibrio sp.]|nr:hypothetical protein [Cellvibrio sp.]